MGQQSVGVTDPIYPVYVDSNVMIGRAGVLRMVQMDNVTYFPCTAENNFVPQIPDRHVDMIYLCYPNNPTGTVLPKEELRKWVNFALRNDSILFYDAAYEAYITDPDIPHSIYEIKGARKCAIEFHSYSKTAGFTGVRCGYTIIPKELTAVTVDGKQRRQSQPVVGSPTEHEVQRNKLYQPARRRGHLHARGQEADPGDHRLLYGERKDHARDA
jgi:LL-diaminopimelate aminotransferase